MRSDRPRLCRRPARCVPLLVALAAWLLPMAANGQLKLPASGEAPSEKITGSLIMSDLAEQYRTWWKEPVVPHQKRWRDSVNGQADRKTSGQVPEDVGAAITDSSIAQAAAIRWAMTGQQKDLDKAVDALTHSATAIRSPFKSSAVYLNYVVAYDFIAAAPIDAKVRAQIEQRLRDSVRADLVFYKNMTKTNLRAKVAGTKAFAGVVLRDKALLNDGLKNLGISFGHNTTDDGWYTDGPGHYFNYTIPHVVAFLRAYHTGSGVSLYPNIAPFIDMTLGMRMPNGFTPNVSQGGNLLTCVHMFSHGLDPERKANVLWHLTSTIPPGYGWTSYTNTCNDDWSQSRHFWSTDFSARPKAPSRSPTYFSPGQAKITAFRSDWSPQSDFLLLSPGIDSPPHDRFLGEGIAFHSHNDSGEFLVFTRGEYVLVAPGYARTDLSNSPKGFSPREADWHNVILVNGNVGDKNEGRTLRPENVVHTNRLDSTEHGRFKGVNDFATLKLNYTNTNVRRSVAFPNEDYFVVADTMQSEATNAYTFNLVGRGALTVLADTPELMRAQWVVGDAAVIEHLVGTHPMSLSHDELWMHDTYNVFERTQRMQATVKAKGAGFLSVIETAARAEAGKLAVADRSTAQFAAVTVVNGEAGYRDVIVSQPTRVRRRIDDITTDALFAYVRYRGDVIDSLMIAQGTTVSCGGKTMCEASAPVTVSALFAPDRVRHTVSPDGLTAGLKLSLGGQTVDLRAGK